VDANAEPKPEGEAADGGDDAKKDAPKNESAPVDALMAYQYHVYVPEVVRESNMHFYRVPRLGAFMAVPLDYNSCLFEKSLD
jgi:hypothetical protein